MHKHRLKQDNSTVVVYAICAVSNIVVPDQTVRDGMEDDLLRSMSPTQLRCGGRGVVFHRISRGKPKLNQRSNPALYTSLSPARCSGLSWCASVDSGPQTLAMGSLDVDGPPTGYFYRHTDNEPYALVKSCSPLYVETVNGQRILDATGGAAVSAVGHRNARVKKSHHFRSSTK